MELPHLFRHQHVMGARDDQATGRDCRELLPSIEHGGLPVRIVGVRPTELGLGVNPQKRGLSRLRFREKLRENDLEPELSLAGGFVLDWHRLVGHLLLKSLELLQYGRVAVSPHLIVLLGEACRTMEENRGGQGLLELSREIDEIRGPVRPSDGVDGFEAEVATQRVEIGSDGSHTHIRLFSDPFRLTHAARVEVDQGEAFFQGLVNRTQVPRGSGPTSLERSSLRDLGRALRNECRSH